VKTALVTITLRIPLDREECLIDGNQFLTDEELSEAFWADFDFPIIYRELHAGRWQLEDHTVRLEGEWEEGEA
jgi:hypothetical protein